ncbi:hypothetical protein PSN_2254 [Pseudomonas sp. NGC7]
MCLHPTEAFLICIKKKQGRANTSQLSFIRLNWGCCAAHRRQASSYR